MKKQTLLITILCLTLALSAQWQWQNPLPQGNNINKILFTDDDHGWVVGEGGLRMFTADGGESWSISNIEASIDLNSVYFLNSDVGWLVGQDTMLKTTDGGSTWLPVNYTGDYSFYDVCFLDENIGWGMTYHSIFHTVDGGSTWTMMFAGFYTGRPYSICFVNDSTGWFSGYVKYGNFDRRTIVLQTKDTGITWDIVVSVPCDYSWTRSDVYFVNENEGWVGSQDGMVRHTSNGGGVWEVQNTGFDYDIYDLFFINSSRGWAVCDNGTILRTTNGGDTWIFMHHEPDFVPSSVYFSTVSKGWVAGTDGKIIQTNNGGLHWDPQTNSPGVTEKKLADGFFVDDEIGWAVGDEGTIIQTSDGGENWETQSSPAYNSDDLKSVYFIDQNKGWIVCDSKILKTLDGGLNWTVNNMSDYVLNDIYFIDHNHGWIAGMNSSEENGVILHTQDGGNDWQIQYESTITDTTDWLNALTFTDSLHGWAVGALHQAWYSSYTESIILHTEDGGVTWIEQENEAPANLTSVHFLNNLSGWTSGSYNGYETDWDYVLHTNDGGQNWEIQYESGWGSENSYKAINSIYFTDPLNGWAVGGWNDYYERGGMLSTSDGGETWEEHYCPTTDNLYSLYFTDENHGWTFGNNGTILNFDLGGITEIPNFKNPKSNTEFFIYPNPCSGAAHLRISNINLWDPFGKQQTIKLEVFTISGIKIKELMNEEKLPGTYEIEMDLRDLPAGVYYCVLKTKNGTSSTKLIKL